MGGIEGEEEEDRKTETESVNPYIETESPGPEMLGTILSSAFPLQQTSCKKISVAGFDQLWF